MNKKIIFPIFLLEAALCPFIAIFRFSSGDILASAMAFPFAQIGAGLRWLSLSGKLGNLMAIVLYVLLSLLPCIVVLLVKRKRKPAYEDVLVVVLSGLLFAVLYQMINPGLLPMAFIAPGNGMAKAMAGATVYSVLCTYIVLRLVRLFCKSQTHRLQKYMVWLLLIVNAIFVYLLFGAGVNELIYGIEALQEANAGNEHLLGTSYLFLGLRFIVGSIPTAFNIAIVFSGIALLGALADNRYSEETVATAAKLSKWCRLSLVVMVTSNAIFNVLQFLFAAKLNTVNSNIQIPVFSILFALAALLFSRFATENKALKEDNDSII